MLIKHSSNQSTLPFVRTLAITGAILSVATIVAAFVLPLFCHSLYANFSSIATYSGSVALLGCICLLLQRSILTNQLLQLIEKADNAYKRHRTCKNPLESTRDIVLERNTMQEARNLVIEHKNFILPLDQEIIRGIASPELLSMLSVFQPTIKITLLLTKELRQGYRQFLLAK